MKSVTSSTYVYIESVFANLSSQLDMFPFLLKLRLQFSVDISYKCLVENDYRRLKRLKALNCLSFVKVSLTVDFLSGRLSKIEPFPLSFSVGAK